jgi:hypothetical protein
MEYHTISVRMDEGVYNKLQDLVDRSGQSQGGVLRTLLVMAEINPDPPFWLPATPMLRNTDKRRGRPRKMSS